LAGYGSSSSNLTGNSNTCLGYNSGFSLQGVANDNTLLGSNAGKVLTTGADNTIVGNTACDTTLTNGSGNTVIGNNTDTSASGGSNQIVIGSNVDGGGDSTARLGTSSGSATLNIDGSDTSWAAASDERLKKDIADCSVGLNFVKELRPVTYKWNAKNAVASDLPQYNKDSSDPVYGSGKTEHGFVAQEVKKVIDNYSGLKDGFTMWSEDPNGTQQVAPAALIPMLVKAIQELETRIATLEGG
jgi:hypothetical protein